MLKESFNCVLLRVETSEYVIFKEEGIHGFLFFCGVILSKLGSLGCTRKQSRTGCSTYGRWMLCLFCFHLVAVNISSEDLGDVM